MKCEGMTICFAKIHNKKKWIQENKYIKVGDYRSESVVNHFVYFAANVFDKC